MTGIEKWSTIYYTMCDQKIAILAIQETHLDNELLSQVVQCYRKCLTLITSSNPTLPHISAGVAFAINKCLLNLSKITIFELVEGHALALKLKWHDMEETTLLNIYAPNSKASQPEFWRKLEMRKRLYRLRNPNFMLGDFNVTEDAIDCSSLHLDNPDAITTIRDKHHQWGLYDA
jgi:exonuclease III